MSGDANYLSRSLGLHFDGSNGSTTFTDNSPTPKTATVLGNAQISTAQSVFGGASGLFDGAGDYLSYADHADFKFGSGDFSIRCKVRFAGYPANNGGNYVSTLVSKDISAGANSEEFSFLVTGTASSFTSLGFVGYSSDTVSEYVSQAFSFALNTWYDVEVCRSGNLLYLFVDGGLLNSGGTAFSTTLQTTTTGLQIGTLEWDATFKYYLNGNLDDLLIYKGVALHTASFTPPALAFSNGLSEIESSQAQSTTAAAGLSVSAVQASGQTQSASAIFSISVSAAPSRAGLNSAALNSLMLNGLENGAFVSASAQAQTTLAASGLAVDCSAVSAQAQSSAAVASASVSCSAAGSQAQSGASTADRSVAATASAAQAQSSTSGSTLSTSLVGASAQAQSATAAAALAIASAMASAQAQSAAAQAGGGAFAASAQAQSAQATAGLSISSSAASAQAQSTGAAAYIPGVSTASSAQAQSAEATFMREVVAFANSAQAQSAGGATGSGLILEHINFALVADALNFGVNDTAVNFALVADALDFGMTTELFDFGVDA